MHTRDYLATEFAAFGEKPFNPVVSAVLSQFCIVRAKGVVPALREQKAFSGLGTLAQNRPSPSLSVFPGMSPGLGTPAQDRLSPMQRPARLAGLLSAGGCGKMLTGLAPGKVKGNLLTLEASPRFRDAVVSSYLSLFDAGRQTQFAAMTFLDGRDFSYIGFCGFCGFCGATAFFTG